MRSITYRCLLPKECIDLPCAPKLSISIASNRDFPKQYSLGSYQGSSIYSLKVLVEMKYCG